VREEAHQPNRSNCFVLRGTTHELIGQERLS
jgi:hypothetical protein